MNLPPELMTVLKRYVWRHNIDMKYAACGLTIEQIVETAKREVDASVEACHLLEAMGFGGDE